MSLRKRSSFLLSRKTIVALLALSVNVFLIFVLIIAHSSKTGPVVIINTNRPRPRTHYRNIKNNLNRYTVDTFYHLDHNLSFPIKSSRVKELIVCSEHLIGKSFSTKPDLWQFIDNGEFNETYVYSAYYDSREDPPLVRILGISSGVTFASDLSLKYCYLWFKGISQPDVVVAEYVIIPETHEKLYAASFHICIVNRKTIPIAVSLSSQRCKIPPNSIRVVDNSPYTDRPAYNFTVCVTPLNFNYDNVVQLVESIEINRVFGANHFIFYNYSSSSLVSRVLQKYVEDGIAEVLTWNIPVNVDRRPADPKVEVEIHYFAQLASLNDCLYRSLFKSKFVVFSDMDELVVPQHHENWFEMLRHATAEAEAKNAFLQDLPEDRPFPGSYLIKNVFLPLQWEENNLTNLDSHDAGKFETLKKDLRLNNDVFKKAVRHRLNTVFKTSCENKIYTWYVRSKYIIRTRVVEMVAVHQALSFLGPLKTWQVTVHARTGLLYHFREWNSNPHDQITKSSCIRLRHFASRYVPSVVQRLETLK